MKTNQNVEETSDIYIETFFFSVPKPVFFSGESSYMFTVGNQWVTWPSMPESRFWVCAGCVNDARVPGNTSKCVYRLLALSPVVRLTTFYSGSSAKKNTEINGFCPYKKKRSYNYKHVFLLTKIKQNMTHFHKCLPKKVWLVKNMYAELIEISSNLQE